jgi:hypothetical protein
MTRRPSTKWLLSCRTGCDAWCNATWHLQRGSNSDGRLERQAFQHSWTWHHWTRDWRVTLCSGCYEHWQRRHLLHDESAQTAVERGDGLIPAVRVKTGGQRLPSLQQLADTFDECIVPAKLEASTRGGYQAAWRTVLTWGVDHDSVHLLLPMIQTTLKALTLELLMVGCAAGTIKNGWCSIEDRHRRFGLPLPLGLAGDFRRLYKAVCAMHRAPSRICFPIGPHRVKQLLDLVGLTGAQL